MQRKLDVLRNHSGLSTSIYTEALIKPISKVNKYFYDPAYTSPILYSAFEKDRIPVLPSYFHPASRIYRSRIPHPASILSLIPHPAKPMLTLSVEFDPILESHLLKEGIATLFVGDLTHHTPLSIISPSHDLNNK